MQECLIDLSDEDMVIFQAYFRWHAAQPESSFRRLLPATRLENLDDLMATLLAPWRVMMQQWWAQHPELHGQESTPDA